MRNRPRPAHSLLLFSTNKLASFCGWLPGMKMFDLLPSNASSYTKNSRHANDINIVLNSLRELLMWNNCKAAHLHRANEQPELLT